MPERTRRIVKLGRELDLFHFQEEGPGTVFWHPKGWSLFQSLISYMRRRLDRLGYQEVNAPQLLDLRGIGGTTMPANLRLAIMRVQ